MIVKAIDNFYQFKNEFEGTTYENHFTYDGLVELFHHLDELDTVLDVIEITCVYKEITKENMHEYGNNMSLDELYKEYAKDINKYTIPVYNADRKLVSFIQEF
jgi:hypothetical protein